VGAGRQDQRHRREPGGQQNADSHSEKPQAIALLPKLSLAVPGKFTVAVAALNSPPLTVFADDNKTLLGSEVDIARLVAESLGWS
jgi:polar amino acid transport system substrate-binding protein